MKFICNELLDNSTHEVRTARKHTEVSTTSQALVGSSKQYV